MGGGAGVMFVFPNTIFRQKRVIVQHLQGYLAFCDMTISLISNLSLCRRLSFAELLIKNPLGIWRPLMALLQISLPPTPQPHL